MGATALMYAASAGYSAIVEALIRAGANPALVNNDGKTASQLAIDNGFDAIADFLGHAGGSE